MVTIGLAMDYIGGAQVGQWLAAEPDVIKIASAICFAQCFVKADDVVIERANGTFRVMRLATQTPASGEQWGHVIRFRIEHAIRHGVIALVSHLRRSPQPSVKYPVLHNVDSRARQVAEQC
jgi:hypothetical protein